MNILIVEDEVRLADALTQIFREQKYMADAVHDGNDGLYCALNGQYDVIVLDVMLPGLDGFQLVRKLRDAGNTTPVLLLTARDNTGDKVTGLDSGADDYLTKPFQTEELLARIRALSRRPGDAVFHELTFCDLTLRLSACELCCGSRTVRLPFKEFEIMRILMSHPSRITAKEELIARVWGCDSDALDNNVEAYISFLRKKIQYLKSGCAIVTRRKAGYHLECPAGEPS